MTSTVTAITGDSPYTIMLPPLSETTAARVTPFDEELQRAISETRRDFTRAIVSLVLATGFACIVRRR